MMKKVTQILIFKMLKQVSYASTPQDIYIYTYIDFYENLFIDNIHLLIFLGGDEHIIYLCHQYYHPFLFKKPNAIMWVTNLFCGIIAVNK